MNRVLVLEGESDARNNLTFMLNGNGFEAIGVESGHGIYEYLRHVRPNIILLNQDLPSGPKGLEIINLVRQNPDFSLIPIIMMSLDGEHELKIEALNMGADDCVSKPVQPRELQARIKAVLRRSVQSSKQIFDQLENDGLVVDLKSHRVTLDEVDVYLTLTEFRILSELLKQKGQVLSRDKLREMALGNLNVTDRTIDVHMASLRKKLGRCAQAIQTVRGVGYKHTIASKRPVATV